MDDDGSKALSK
jgi:calcyphosin